MPPSVVTDIFAAESAPVVYTCTVSSTQLDYTAVTTIAYQDGVQTEPDSWTLTTPTGSSSSLAGSGGTRSYTPDQPGIYEEVITYGTTVVRRVVRVGLAVGGGVWAQVLVDTDYTGESNQDISGGGAVTIGGVSAFSSVSGAPDVWAVQNGTGLRCTEASGGAVTCRLAYDLAALGVVAGDTVIIELDVDPLSMGLNDDRIYCALTQSNAGLGTDFACMVLRRVNATSYVYFLAATSGLKNHGSLGASAPGDCRLAVIHGDRQGDGRIDTTAGGLTPPNAITYRGSFRNTDSQANAEQNASRYAASDAVKYATILVVAGTSDIVVRGVRISRAPARGAA